MIFEMAMIIELLSKESEANQSPKGKLYVLHVAKLEGWGY